MYRYFSLTPHGDAIFGSAQLFQWKHATRQRCCVFVVFCKTIKSIYKYVYTSLVRTCLKPSQQHYASDFVEKESPVLT